MEKSVRCSTLRFSIFLLTFLSNRTREEKVFSDFPFFSPISKQTQIYFSPNLTTTTLFFSQSKERASNYQNKTNIRKKRNSTFKITTKFSHHHNPFLFSPSSHNPKTGPLIIQKKKKQNKKKKGNSTCRGTNQQNSSHAEILGDPFAHRNDVAHFRGSGERRPTGGLTDAPHVEGNGVESSAGESKCDALHQALASAQYRVGMDQHDCQRAFLF